MDRRERLHALVDVLRAASPRLLTVGRLAVRFDVSERTVQRDLQALMSAGVPVRYESGPRGGWTVDRRHSLPPLQLTEREALALTLAAAGARQPLGPDARAAVAKIRAVLAPETNAVVDRVVGSAAALRVADSAVEEAVGRAVLTHTALRLDYVDASGSASSRIVEPIGLLAGDREWYLIAWCRTRGAERGFRLDRIAAAHGTGEPVPARPLLPALADGPAAGARPIV